VKYVVVNKEITPDLMQSYYLKDIGEFQGEDFYREILGLKIRDFGDKFSLYKVNDSYYQPIISIENRQKSGHTDPEVSYLPLGDNRYSIRINNLNGYANLLFLEPFNSMWELGVNKDWHHDFDFDHEIANGYANKWVLSTDYVTANVPNKFYTFNDDGSINLELLLYFKPSIFRKALYSVSIATLLACVAFLMRGCFLSKK